MLVKQANIIDLFRRVLSYIDKRLIRHGERVAYILYKMMEYGKKSDEQTMTNLFFLGLFHDIGAYKTDEANHIVKFDDEQTMNHSIYGYLFLKYLSPLGDFAEVLLYHHIDYDEKSCYSSIYLDLSLLIHLADIIDLTKYNLDNNYPELLLSDYSDKRFSSSDIDTFIKANIKYNILEKIKDGSYIDEFNKICESIKYDGNLLLEYLHMLVYTIDFKSEFTVTHTILVESISRHIAKHLKLNDNVIEEIALASWLHDIGKIAISIDILEKPGILTNDEMIIMKEHVRYSEEILKGVVDQRIVNIAIRHHEKLDGSGYYYGLYDKDLTLEDKILAVADIISALAGRRSYKEALDKDEIIKIIIELAKNQKISSKIVECIVKNYDEIINNAISDSQHVINNYLQIKNDYDKIKNQFYNDKIVVAL